MTKGRSLFALLAALVLLVGFGGSSASAQAADVAIGETPITFAEPWRPSILAPVLAADHAVLKAGSSAVVISAPVEGAAFADQVVTSLKTFAPHVSVDVLTVTMDEEAFQAGTFQNSGETYMYVALAPTADVPFVQIALAPEADLAAAVTSAQETVKVGDAAVFTGVTIDSMAITVQTEGAPAASPEASPAS